MNDTLELIKSQISNNTVLLYMKGTPDFPMCGFSAKVANILLRLNTSFSFVNILENPDIRSQLPKYANWPTFPQLYINGELIGGCDIVVEEYESGDLEQHLTKAGAITNEPEIAKA